MARCYSVRMRQRQSLPALWLLSDQRNDAGIEAALKRLPRGSGFIFRHYHLKPDERHARFVQLARLARARGHRIVLSGTAREARAWGADGAYGPPERLTRGPALLRLATAHDLREIAAGHRARADAMLLSPAFPTRSHPSGKTLGPLRFRLLAARALVPAIALGGMNRARAARLRWRNWAAIDGI